MSGIPKELLDWRNEKPDERVVSHNRRMSAYVLQQRIALGGNQIAIAEAVITEIEWTTSKMSPYDLLSHYESQIEDIIKERTKPEPPEQP